MNSNHLFTPVPTSYDPFGMVMPGREFAAEEYKFGFNGKEKNIELIYGNYDYGMRVYESRIGRWIEIDSKTKKYPALSPYLNSNNSPNLYYDFDGQDYIFSIIKGKILISQTIYPVNDQAAKELGPAVASWNALSGTKVSINGETFIVDINLVIASTPVSPMDAFNQYQADDFSNIYFGENQLWLDNNGDLIPKNESVMAGSGVHAGATIHGDKYQTAFYQIRSSDGSGNIISTENRHYGQNVRTVAHEIGHTLGLEDPPHVVPNSPYFAPGGVMEYNGQNGATGKEMPTRWDLMKIVQAGVDMANGTLKNSANSLEINVINKDKINLNSNSVALVINTTTPSCGNSTQSEGTDPGVIIKNEIQ